MSEETDFTLRNCFFATKLNANPGLNKYGYSGYGIDVMHIHNFHGQTVNGVKIMLFLELIIVSCAF